jgi:predicted phosphodiesterase
MIALISDIHGNYTALQAVLKEIDGMGIKEIYCLGDTVGYYSQINECCYELRKRNVLSVMGNHDFYIATNSKCPRSKSANNCLEYQRKIITQENYNWISKLPILLKFEELIMMHGGLINPIDEYLNPVVEYFSQINTKYFASGHTHKQIIKELPNTIYCNPGSVGQPRDGNPNAAFATFDGKNFNLHRVKYDYNIVCKLMKDAGFSSHYYNCLKNGNPKLGD